MPTLLLRLRSHPFAVRAFAVCAFAALVVGLALLALGAHGQPAYGQAAEADAVPRGSVRGTVLDAATRTPLPGVNVVLDGTTMGASTGADGTYVIPAVPVGSYRLAFRFIGYATFVQTDVVVRAGRATPVDAMLREQVLEGEGVTVTAGYFRTRDTEPTSVATLSAEELRRAPGAGQEVVRVLNALPGVAARGETSQDLFVRGGAPVENGFYIDNIFVPTTQHFAGPTGSSNGPTGLLNTAFIKQIDFSTGGFSAAFGDRLSAIGEIEYRDGNPDAVAGEVGLNFTGGTGILEGPLPEGRGSWFVSARRSYLDLVADVINAGGAPRFGDAQGKATLDLAPGHTLSVLGLYGQSRFTQDQADAEDDGEPSFVDLQTSQSTVGATWKALVGGRGVASTSVAYSFRRSDLATRDVATQALDLGEALFDQYVAVRNRTFVQVSGRVQLEGGAEAMVERSRVTIDQAAFTGRTGTPQPAVRRDETLTSTRLSPFASAIVRPGPRLTATLGLRLDHHTLNGDTYVSPRLALAYQLTDRLALTGSAGVFRQAVPLFIVAQNEANEALSAMRADHLIAGVEYLVTPDTKVRLEGYHKRYRAMPQLAEGNGLADPIFVLDNRGDFSGELTSDGRGFAQGVELFMQKKLARRVYGLVSASVFRSRYRDFAGVWRDRDFDTRTLFSAIGGYRPTDRWEVSARWTYFGGRPTTPIDAAASASAGETVLDGSRFNEARLPAFHSLYLRVDRRFFVRGTGLTTFVSLWNAYSRTNVEARFWNVTDGGVEDREQFSVLPVVGVEWTF